MLLPQTIAIFVQQFGSFFLKIRFFCKLQQLVKHLILIKWILLIPEKSYQTLFKNINNCAIA